MDAIKRDRPNLDPLKLAVTATPRYVENGQLMWVVTLTYDGQFVTSTSAIPMSRVDGWFKESTELLGIKFASITTSGTFVIDIPTD
jgi:hypothetical protein